MSEIYLMICRARGSIGAMEYERAVLQLLVYGVTLFMLYAVDRWYRG
jgi:hypothetical protein